MFTCSGLPNGRVLESGDIVHGKRTQSGEVECAVVLGFAGETLIVFTVC